MRTLLMTTVFAAALAACQRGPAAVPATTGPSGPEQAPNAEPIETAEVDDGDGLRELARCLTRRGARMYGAHWCGACNVQKRAFGDAASELPYVECAPPGTRGQAPQCREAGIRAYPTWTFSDGSRLEGAHPPATLAERAGCPAP